MPETERLLIRKFTLADLDKLIDSENKSSRRIIEKCGMKYKKTETHYGSERVFYAVSKNEFLYLIN